ncbi:MAG: PAS domain-containing protein, partial [Sphingobium sp.]
MPHSSQLSREQLIERQAFQIALMDRLRHLASPRAIIAASTEMLGEALSAGRCGFCTISEDGLSARMDADWSGDLDPMNENVQMLGTLGSGILDELRAGRTLVVHDAGTDPRTVDHQASWAALGVSAVIAVPLFRADRFDSVVYVHNRTAREWTQSDVTLAEDVALRMREATDRAWSEAELRASEMRYRNLFESIDSGFCVVEVAFDGENRPRDYRFLEANASFERATGIIGAAGRWISDALPQHEQKWLDLYARVALTGHAERLELPARAIGDRWFLVHAYRVDEPHQRHVAALFTDLTSRKKSEKALERSREELELATRAAELGRFAYYPREARLVWDERCRQLFGLGPEAPVTYEDSFIAGLHPDDRVRAAKAVTAALKPHGNRRFEVEYRTVGLEDGILRHVIAHGLAFFDGDEPARLLGTVQDVTRDREANAVLREVEERLRLAGRATNDAVWDWDLRTNHVTWNDALRRAYGHALTNVEPTGEWWLSNIHPDDRARIDASIHRVIRDGSSDWAEEYRFARIDGSYADVFDRGYVLRDGDGSALRMVGAMLDVSARKAVERQLEEERRRLADEVDATAAERDRAEEALRQAQKMEAVGQLTGGIAHDFNNLLTGISGAMEMIQLRVAQGRTDALEKYTVAAQGAVRRAAALTHRLLAFSRRQTLDPKPTNVNRLILDIEDMIARAVGPQILLEIASETSLWTTLVDPNQLENALLNLCINARDAMPDGGRITIATANVEMDERAGSERDLDPGDYIAISVSDTGTGMAPEVMYRAFDPFFTTKPQGQGTGLGLSMIYGFVRQSGGQVRIHTTEGIGTTMKLYLPRLDGVTVHDDGPIVETASLHGATNAQRTGCILVVDDEPTVRMLVVEVAEGLGYEVLQAPDGPAGVQIAQDRPDIDFLITDVGLP